MSNGSAEIYPREFDISEILSISWDIYKINYSALFPLAFIVYLPLNIFLAFFPIGNITELDTSSYSSWFKIFGTMNIAVYLSFIGNVAVALALKKKIDKLEYKLIDIAKEIGAKYFAHIANNTFMLFLVFLLFNTWMYTSVLYPVIFMVLLIPIVVYLVYWSFTIYVFSFKDLNLYESMKYSYSIVNGRWSKVFLYIVIFILLSALTSMVGGLPYSYLHDNIIMRIFYTNLISVITSYFVVAFIVFYVNFEDTKL
jgi:hypothetical protein